MDGNRDFDKKYTFLQFCHDVLEPTIDTTDRNMKKQIITRFFEEIYRSDNTFPVMRLLCPDYDRSRPNFGIKTSVYAETIRSMLNLDKKSRDARRLVDFTNAKLFEGTNVTCGDFYSVLEFVLKDRVGNDEKPATKRTIFEINQFLDELAKASTAKDRKKLFCEFVYKMTPKEQAWIARIILKDMKISFSSDSVLRLYHPDACEVWSNTSSLEKVCDICKDPRVRLNKADIKLFDEIRPMLCGKMKRDTSLSALMRGGSLIEPKYDGWRCLLHYEKEKNGKNKTIRCFTRKGIECTNLIKSLSDTVKALLSRSRVSSCILDGELVGWDEKREMTVIPREMQPIAAGTIKGHHVCYIAFDVLYLNGQATILKPLKERKELLERHVLPVQKPKYVEVIDHEYVEHMDLAIAKKSLEDHCLTRSVHDNILHEGIVIKQIDSPYTINVRSRSWIKMKPDFYDYMSDDADLIILGASYPKSARLSGKLATFLVGVSREQLSDDYEKEDGNGNGKRKSLPRDSYLCIGRVGNLKDESVEEINKLTGWKPYDRNHPPSHLKSPPAATADLPHMWIDPRDSVILQVRSAGIEPGSYSSGLHILFPRPHPPDAPIRHDKRWNEGWTLEDVRDEIERTKLLINAKPSFGVGSSGSGSVGRMKREREANRGARVKVELKSGSAGALVHSPTPKKRKTVTRSTNRNRGRVLHTVTIGADSIKPKSTLFQDVRFHCFPMKDQDHDGIDQRTKIARIVVEHGGIYDNNPNSDTRYRIGDEDNGVFVRAAREGGFDVIRPQWITRCIENKALVKFTPDDVIHAGNDTRRALAAEYDVYGDSYHDLTSTEQLGAILQSMDSGPIQCLLDHNHTHHHHSTADLHSSSGSGISRDRDQGVNVVADDDDEGAGVGEREASSMPVRMRMDDVGVSFDEFDSDELEEIDQVLCAYFRNCTMVVECGPDDGYLESICSDIRCFGGTVAEILDSNVTHIVVADSAMPRIGEIREAAREHGRGDIPISIVKYRWIYDSIVQNRRLPESADYLL